MNMWRRNEPAEEDVSVPPGMDLQNNAADRVDALGVTALLTNPFRNLEDVRSYRACPRRKR
jgi:hypothetical protein